MQQKISQYLNKTYLGWVVMDSLPRAKVISLMSRIGIYYKGLRMESIPLQELAYSLSEEALAHSNIMVMLIKVLNTENALVIERVAAMPEDGAGKMVLDPGKIFSFAKPGRVLWALVADNRPRINALAKELAAAIDSFIKEEPLFEESAAINDSRRNSRTDLKRENKLLARRVISLEENVASGARFSEELQRENVRLRDKVFSQQALLAELRRRCGEADREKGALNNSAARDKNEIERLLRQISELKNAMAVGPKMRLKAEIRRLRKENDNLTHASEKERQIADGKTGLLEKELQRLKHDLQEAGLKNAELSELLEKERKKYALLEKEFRPASSGKEPPPPMEKGKRLGIFIDNQNVYYSARTYFGKKIDFQKLLAALVKDRHLVKAMCYVVEQPEGGGSQENFFAMLKNNGYTVRIRELIRRADGSAKGNWDIGIAADVITMAEKNKLDVVVLVTCDGDFVDLVKLLSAKGVRVEVVGFAMNMAMSLKMSADQYYFITKDLMRDGDTAVKPE